MARLAPSIQTRFADRRIVVLAATLPFALLVAGVAAALSLEDSSRRILTAVLAAAFVAVALPWTLRSRALRRAEDSGAPDAPAVGIDYAFACPFDLLDQTSHAGFIATVTVSSTGTAIDPQRRQPSLRWVLAPLVRDAVVAASDRLGPDLDSDPVVALETVRIAAQTLLRERMVGPVSGLPEGLTANVTAVSVPLTRTLSGRPCRSTELEWDAASQTRRSPVAAPVVNTQPSSPIEQPAPAEREVERIVRAAAGGDAAAWMELVARFDGLVWAVARSHRLSSADAADVVQCTWLKLVQHLGDLRNPAAVGGWLATTARRECVRLLPVSRQQIPFGDDLSGPAAAEPALDADLLRRERDAVLWQAVSSLRPEDQALVRMLAADPPASHGEISALGMPSGSIGPTRARYSQRLRAAWISQSRTTRGS